MAFFLKHNANGAAWSYCYAAEIEPTNSGHAILQPQIPIAGHDGATAMVLAGGRLTLTTDRGLFHAFRIMAPSWMTLLAPDTPRLPRGLPNSVADRGEDAAFDYLWTTTSIKTVFAQPAIRRVVAEEMILDQSAAILRSPVFLPDDLAAIERWAAARPQAYAAARANAAALVAEQSLVGEAAEVRTRCRLEAFRKLDMRQVAERWHSCPQLGGEPWIPFATPVGPLRVGRSRDEEEFPAGNNVPPLPPGSENDSTLQSVEGAIWPGKFTFAQKFEWLRWQRAFRTFEETSPLPAIGYLSWSDITPVMPGFIERFSAEERKLIPGSCMDLAHVGVPTWISKVAQEFLRERHPNPPLPEPRDAARWCVKRVWRA